MLLTKETYNLQLIRTINKYIFYKKKKYIKAKMEKAI